MNTNRLLRVAGRALAFCLMASPAYASEDEVRFTPKTVLRGGKMWVADFIQPKKSSGPLWVRLQSAVFDVTGNVQDYRLPLAGGYLGIRSQAESYPIRWDVADGHFVAIVPLTFTPSDWDFTLSRIALEDVAFFPSGQVSHSMAALRKAICARVNHEGIRVEPLSLVDALVRLYQKGTAIHYDFCAVPDGAVVLYLLVGNRMTVWYYPAGTSKGQVKGAHLIEGPSLFGEDKWVRVATFVPGFNGPFLVFVRGELVYFLTKDKRLYVCEGFRTPMQRPISTDPIAQIERGENSRSRCIAFDRGLLQRFLGVPEGRIVTEPVDDVSGIEAVVVDRSANDILWVTRDRITNSSLDRVRQRSEATPAPVEGVTGPIVDLRKYLPDLIAFRSQAPPDN